MVQGRSCSSWLPNHAPLWPGLCRPSRRGRRCAARPVAGSSARARAESRPPYTAPGAEDPPRVVGENALAVAPRGSRVRSAAGSTVRTAFSGRERRHCVQASPSASVVSGCNCEAERCTRKGRRQKCKTAGGNARRITSDDQTRRPRLVWRTSLLLLDAARLLPLAQQRSPTTHHIGQWHPRRPAERARMASALIIRSCRQRRAAPRQRGGLATAPSALQPSGLSRCSPCWCFQAVIPI